MRLIAERLLPVGAGSTCVRSELVSQPVDPLPLPKDGYQFHAYTSLLNPGAAALMVEVAQARSLQLQRSAQLKVEGQSRNVLFITDDAADMARCEHMLLLLTSQTWTRGEESEALGREVSRAMDLGVHVLLVRADGLTLHEHFRRYPRARWLSAAVSAPALRRHMR